MSVVAKPDSEIAKIRRSHGLLVRADGLRKKGDLKDAKVILERIVDSAPDYFAAWNILGLVHLSENDPWAALSCFTRASMLNAYDHATLSNLSRTYHVLGALELAEQTLRLALDLKPESPAVQITLGRLYDERREYELACASFRKALESDPSSAEAHYALGSSLTHLGHLDEALDCFLKTFDLEISVSRYSPAIPGILYAISQNPLFASRLNLLDRVNEFEARFREGTYPANFLFAKSRALDAAGDFERSWAVLLDANQKVWRDIHKEMDITRRRMEAAASYARAFPQIKHSSSGQSVGTAALFIVGASRSGKTTFEKLIGVTQGVKRGYENRIVEDCITRTSQEAGLPTLRDFWYLPESLNQKFSATFKEEIGRRADKARILTVTYPGSIYHAGLVASLIENSFFVFIRRDKFDNTLRCLQKKYNTGNYYSYHPAECSRYIAWYNSMAELWAEKIGQRALVMDYDDLVESPSRQLERLSEMMGISLQMDGTAQLGDDRGCGQPYLTHLRNIE